MRTIPERSDAEEMTAGAVSYLDILERLHRELRPARYLEIGVRHGASLRLAKGPAIGVDPAPEITRPLPDAVRVVSLTSDEFFGSPFEGPPPNLCFIDGMHHFEYALRDFMNVERIAAPGAVIVLDDIFPNHPAQAERLRRTSVWTGDVWRIPETLRRYRPDLFVAAIDAHPAGLLLVARLDNQNRTLRDNYERIVDAAQTPAAPPDAVLQRRGAIDPMSQEFSRILAMLTDSPHR
jgi:predicted O-methyltransferase YrrM